MNKKIYLFTGNGENYNSFLPISNKIKYDKAIHISTNKLLEGGMTLDDWLFVETDDSCAICGIKGTNLLTIHHIDGNHSNNVYDNTIILCHNCHNQDRQDKGLAREQIENRKRHLIQKTLTQYGVNAMKIADRNGFGVVAMPFLLYHLVQLGYMKKEEWQMGYGDQEDATARFSITESGQKLLQKWF